MRLAPRPHHERALAGPPAAARQAPRPRALQAAARSRGALAAGCRARARRTSCLLQVGSREGGDEKQGEVGGWVTVDAGRQAGRSAGPVVVAPSRQRPRTVLLHRRPALLVVVVVAVVVDRRRRGAQRQIKVELQDRIPVLACSRMRISRTVAQREVGVAKTGGCAPGKQDLDLLWATAPPPWPHIWRWY